MRSIFATLVLASLSTLTACSSIGSAPALLRAFAPAAVPAQEGGPAAGLHDRLISSFGPLIGSALTVGVLAAEEVADFAATPRVADAADTGDTGDAGVAGDARAIGSTGATGTTGTAATEVAAAAPLQGLVRAVLTPFRGLLSLVGLGESQPLRRTLEGVVAQVESTWRNAAAVHRLPPEREPAHAAAATPVKAPAVSTAAAPPISAPEAEEDTADDAADFEPNPACMCLLSNGYRPW